MIQGLKLTLESGNCQLKYFLDAVCMNQHQIVAFTTLYASGHKHAKEFYGRSFRGYCARMVGDTMIIKACFYTTFYARKKKVEKRFLPNSSGFATNRRQNCITINRHPVQYSTTTAIFL